MGTENQSARDDSEGDDEGKLLTVQEAATLAGVGETAIRNAILRGRLPEVIRYGRKLILASDLAVYQRDAKPGRPRKASGEAPDE